MTIIHELSVWDYEPWSGAVDTYERICKEGKLDLLAQILDDLYCDRETITDTELNDLLWFEPDSVYEWLGMQTDEEIEEEKQERKAKRDAVLRLLQTDSAVEFCDLWLDTFDMTCATCPLRDAPDCDEDSAIESCRDEIKKAVADLSDELDDEDDA